MEMAQAKLAALLAAALMLGGCYTVAWRSVPMDGSRTGVVASNASNVSEAMGTVQDGTYTAPNGVVFNCGSTPAMARAMLDVQPRMSSLKEVVCQSSRVMESHFPESELSNLLADRLLLCTEQETGRKVDFSVMNFGGIRTELPQGDVLLDDIVSMLPFKNHLCYVELGGKDVKYLFDFMARKRMQVIGGARVVVNEGKIESLEIGGQPLDTNRVYGVATIDFLLDGGDSLYVARNARDLVITDVLVRDILLPYARDLGEKGVPIEYQTDGRVVIEGDPFKK